MFLFLSIMQLLIVLALVFVICIQNNEVGDLSLGLGGSSNSAAKKMFSPSGGSKFFVILTICLGGLFLLNTVSLSYLYNTSNIKIQSVQEPENVEEVISLDASSEDNANE